MSCFRHSDHREWLVVFACLGSALLGSSGAVGQATLDWGGGAGTWDASSASWYDGASTSTWVNGSIARFGGSAGTVVVSGSFSAKDLQFTTPGYSLVPSNSSSRIRPAAADFTVDAQADALIAVDMNTVGTPGMTWIKSGPGALTLESNLSFIDTVRVDEGKLVVKDRFSASFADSVELADVASAEIWVGETTSSNAISLPSLSGGGASGGVIRPLATTGQTGLIVSPDNTTFNGRIDDTGRAELSVTFRFPSEQGLTGASTYRGTTEILFSTLSLREGGSIHPSPVRVHASNFKLDNQVLAVPDRISDTSTVTLASGVVSMIGHPVSPVVELAGPLKLAGACRLQMEESGAPITLTFSDVQPEMWWGLDVSGTGDVVLLNWSPAPAGAAIPGLTWQREAWAALDAGGTVGPAVTSSVSSLDGLGPSDDVWLAMAPAQPVTNLSLRTLQLDAGAGPEQILMIETGSVLGIVGGGLLTRGSDWRIEGGALAGPSSGPLTIWTPERLEIDSLIEDVPGGLPVVKAGPGRLRLHGAQSFSGPLVVVEGILEVGSDAELGTSTNLVLAGGKLDFLADIVSTRTLLNEPSSSHAINTGTQDVTFASVSGALVSKSGTGALTLSQGGFQSCVLIQGTFRPIGAQGGSVTVSGGTLEASGLLDSVRCSPSLESVVLAPGPGPVTLTVNELSATDHFVIEMELGSAASDQLVVNDATLFSWPSPAVTIDLRMDETLLPGTALPLIEFTGPVSLANPLSQFALADGLAYLGWDVELTWSNQTIWAVVHAVGVEETGDPSPLRVVGATRSAVTLAWEDSSNLETEFEVEYDRGFGFGFQSFRSLPSNTVTTTVTGLRSTTQVRFRVRGRNDAGASTWSNELRLEPPTSLTAWRTLIFGTNQPVGDAADFADPDGDGKTNKEEYYYGTPPLLADTSPPPAPIWLESGFNSYIGLRYSRTVSASGAASVLETNGNWMGWGVVPGRFKSTEDRGDGTQWVNEFAPTPIHQIDANPFLLRLRVY